MASGTIKEESNAYIGNTIIVNVTANTAGWTEPNNITNVISNPPIKSGYTIVGFLCRSGTYKIVCPYAKTSSGHWEIHFYANTSIEGVVYAVPIYQRN